MNDKNYATRQEAKQSIFKYIELHYIHSDCIPS
ncbi:MAG: hypothetical protein GXP13_03355 [Gammaproteobacteria bacterium]|nr:hypothetical protein [Gammaproteobacteria bacterium]